MATQCNSERNNRKLDYRAFPIPTDKREREKCFI